MCSHVTVGLDTLIMRVLVIFFLFSIVSLSAGRYTSVSGPRRGKIIGGNDARPRSHPYLVSLHMRFLWTRFRLCSGSLLSEKWILTAGHCLKGNWLLNWLPMEALVGTHDLVHKDVSAQAVNIAERIVHPLYSGGLGAYDIAMLKTRKNIKFNSDVYPIGLPFSTGSYRNNFKNLILAGWGVLETTVFIPALSDKLQETRVEHIPYDVCHEAVDAIKESYEDNPLDKEANICTGPITGGVAACSGDSGAPLIQYVAHSEQEPTSTTPVDIDSWSENSNEIDTTTNNDMDSDETTIAERKPVEKILTVADLVQQYKDQGLTPVAIGVVSWGVTPCGEVGAPTVYTNVSTYADFIQQHLYT